MKIYAEPAGDIWAPSPISWYLPTTIISSNSGTGAKLIPTTTDIGRAKALKIVDPGFTYAADGLSKFIPEPTDVLDETKEKILIKRPKIGLGADNYFKVIGKYTKKNIIKNNPIFKFDLK